MICNVISSIFLVASGKLTKFMKKNYFTIIFYLLKFKFSINVTYQNISEMSLKTNWCFVSLQIISFSITLIVNIPTNENKIYKVD